MLLETFASKSYVAFDRGNILSICSQTLSSVPALDLSCTKYSYIWEFGKNLKDLIEILLRTWICPCNASGHSFSFFLFTFSVMHSKMKSLFYLSYTVAASFIGDFCYSDTKVTEKFRSFLPLKHYFPFSDLISRTYILS